jgi:hypothetical protein
MCALGTENGHHFFVTVETASLRGRLAVRGYVMTIDADAERTFSSRAAPASGPLRA